jgi:hypothetical protein
MTDPRPARALRLLAVVALAAASPPALAASGVLFSGSVFVDYWRIFDAEASSHSPQGMAPATSMRVTLDATDDVSLTAKACAGCHTFEMEQVAIDYAPRSWFNVQVGRLSVPFGEFSQRVDDSGHRTGSAPLIYDMGRMAWGGRSAMNLGVLPLPYTDTGVLVYGVKWIGEALQVWYGAYGVSGLRGGNDVDWMAMRSGSYIDPNEDPAAGGRVAMTLSAGAGSFIGDANLGGSFTAGRYDRAGRLGYAVWGLDASVKLGPVTVRGEYAARRTDLDPAASGYRFALVDPWFRKDGFYLEAEHPLGKYLALVYRYDELRRSGVPLPGSVAQLSTDSRIRRATGGVEFTPAQGIFAKASWEGWDMNDFGRFHTFHLGLGGTF